MMQSDWTDLCNLAFDLNQRTHQHFDRLSLETLKGLEAMAREEIPADSTMFTFLRAWLQEEIAWRENPVPPPAPRGMRDNNDLPF